MAHIHKKTKNGRTYYYIREMARVGGKPKVVNQIYLGTIERLIELARGGAERCLKISAQEFGSLWLASLIEQEVGLTSVIDSVLPKGPKETGPSVGEYFLYAVWNRMIDACSKRALPEWYKKTAIQLIRPVDTHELTSQHYWDKWNRVGEEDIEKIASLFFEKIAALDTNKSDCFLFDTTNFYTYMASDTESDLAKRGKSKEGKDWLRQVGVALLVSQESEVPLFYREYEGNRHDSKLFQQILSDVLFAMKRYGRGDAELTIVVDKGMNSEENIAKIDASEGVHFITTYSTHYAEDLVRVKLSEFKPVDTPKNTELVRQGKEDDRIVAFRTTGEFWGRERVVVVTYNPRTATKQRITFEKKLLDLQQTLLELKSKARTQKSHWTKQERIDKHYFDACERLHLPKDLYEISVERDDKGKWQLIFRKNHYRIGNYIERFGKNILISDQTNWSIDQIVRASLDRYMVEKAFRQAKDEDLVSLSPMHHWTDGKIRCHILTCIIALTLLRLLEMRMKQARVSISAQSAMQEMRCLHSCLCWMSSKKIADRVLEEPTSMQAKIMRVFGHEIANGVLQKIKH